MNYMCTLCRTHVRPGPSTQNPPDLHSPSIVDLPEGVPYATELSVHPDLISQKTVYCYRDIKGFEKLRNSYRLE